MVNSLTQTNSTSKETYFLEIWCPGGYFGLKRKVVCYWVHSSSGHFSGRAYKATEKMTQGILLFFPYIIVKWASDRKVGRKFSWPVYENSTFQSPSLLSSILGLKNGRSVYQVSRPLNFYPTLPSLVESQNPSPEQSIPTEVLRLNIILWIFKWLRLGCWPAYCEP